ncbi:MAG TPA: hypothetical protein VI389_00210 [Geobacteraceae bacterium]
MRKTVSLVTITLALLCFAAGCAKKEEAPPQAAQKAAPADPKTAALDPCTLLSADEVSAAAGQPFKPGKREGNSCSFESAEVSAKYSTFMLIVVPDAGNAFERTREIRAKNAALKDLAGVGEVAYASGKDGKDLDVLKKGLWLSVRPIGKAFTGESGEKLGKLAASRLP